MKRCVMYTILAAVMFLSSGVQAVPGDRVLVCHIEGNGFGHIIEVSSSAAQSHYAHGDPVRFQSTQDRPNPQILPRKWLIRPVIIYRKNAHQAIAHPS